MPNGRFPRRIIALAAVVALGCSHPQPDSADNAAAPSETAVAAAVAPKTGEINPRLLRRFQPLPKPRDGEADASEPRVALGRQLFFEPRLSRSGDISCQSCHDLSRFGVDGNSTSPGHLGKQGSRNTPSVYNAAGHFTQFWDGRSPTVEEQAKVPILNPLEMAMASPEAVVEALKAIPEYRESFLRAFPGGKEALTFDNVAAAIGAFERKLSTPGRWDRFLKGESDALTGAEKEGLRVFLDSGCMVCHTGPLLGASMFQRVGVVEPWPNQADQGRAVVTKSDVDRMMFKVPSLRNVAKTAPYFHDGSAATLEIAVRMMGKHQLGLELADSEVASIVTWLTSLTGDVPGTLVARPRLPGEKRERAR